MIWGNTPRSFPPAFSIRGYDVGGTRLLFAPNDTFTVLVVLARRASRSAVLFRGTTLGLQMRAAAFKPEVARLLGVRVGRMFTLGWALAAVAGSLAGVLVAPSVFLGPNQFDPILIFGFVAAVLGGLDSPPGAVVGGLLLGLALSYVSGYEGSSLVPLAALVILIVVLMVRPTRPVLGDPGAARVSTPCAAAASAAARRLLAAARCCARSALVAARRGRAVRRRATYLGAYNDLQLADRRVLLRGARGADGAGRAERPDLARPRRADGRRRVHGRAADRQRGLVAASPRWPPRWSSPRSVGIPVGAAATPAARDRTSPARRSRSRSACRRSRTSSRRRSAARTGWSSTRPTRRRGSGANFPLERWEAWIACAGALVVLFVLYNLIHSGFGRSFRAVRDDEIAASLCGLRVGRMQTIAFVVSAGCAGLGGGPAARSCCSSPRRARFPLQLSLSLLTGGRAGRARVAGRRDLGRRAARAAAELDQRPRALVLALDQGLGEPAAGDLRRRPDRRDARLAERASRAGPGADRPAASAAGAPARPARPRAASSGTPSSAAWTSRSRS